ncbi:hypothetical protein IU487_35120 [Nocardia puris]|uniref:hypothetical protein n=1 Tax=Nocardia puris TaxID=208602 RepID=UPI001893D609|nr:hypothetical protein [Nocardia puris]MBF6216229.1 hypothetical protein [Nocardia puris]
MLTVTEFRARATELVRHVAGRRGERVFVGAHRKPAAVLMAVEADVPAEIREQLLGGYFAYEADFAIRGLRAKRGNFIHIGDPFGKMFVWLWRTAPDDAMRHLAGYLVELRNHPDAPDPPIRLDDVLDALGMTIHLEGRRKEYEEICARARAEVQAYFGQSDVNA